MPIHCPVGRLGLSGACGRAGLSVIVASIASHCGSSDQGAPAGRARSVSQVKACSPCDGRQEASSLFQGMVRALTTRCDGRSATTQSPRDVMQARVKGRGIAAALSLGGMREPSPGQ